MINCDQSEEPMPNDRLRPGEPPRTIRFYERTTTKPDGTTKTVVRARAYVADDKGRRIERAASGATRKQAERALRHVLAQRHEKRGPVINRQTRVSVFAGIMLTEKRDKVAAGQMSPGSLRNYEGHYDRYIDEPLGDLAIEWLTVRTADQFLKTLRETHGYATVKGVRSVLTEIAEVAVRYEVIGRNPVKLAANIPGGATKRVRALEAAEAADLWCKLVALSQGALLDEDGNALPACHRDVPDMALWMLSTGDRIGNALAVHWPWIDLQASPVTAKLGPNVIWVKREGLRLHEGTSKSRAGRLGLPGQCVEMLKVRRIRALNLAGPVFCDGFGGLRDPSNTSRQLKAAFRAVGYGHITSHWFRKTVGSELDRAGLPTSEVAAQLRHADQRTTEKHYMEKRSVNPRATAALEGMLSTSPERKVVGLTRPEDNG
jgi:integrase